jgi:TRAP-type C4-dicarboxylate transport system substrate-binding protein
MRSLLNVEELTGGAVKVDVYYDGTLLSFGDTFQGVSTGVADLGLMGCAAN